MFTDGAKDLLLLGRFARKWKWEQYGKIAPLTEVSGMLGNRDNSNGYPYWTIKERVYGGIGVNYMYRNLKTSQQLDLDASYFLASFSGDFQRYRAQFQQPLWDYFYVTGIAVFYTLKNFYNNNFLLGLKYYFK
ncbi:hypothetical protein [Aequorivita lipolytica]|uniref:Uncharacterized protein n=1 Tax=Aequorivita lipolytica TaxID=153267 RepID=A0A5C6YM78_9FLAO|nr:hypothetical protein [Aequorivita lipolytica]TXD68442.1 hypothetical protein ESV24_12240 [Aequorivita lipolytica]SRX51412.1 hypothetical protein AEQU2_01895 [Aequorivita lipolytica]